MPCTEQSPFSSQTENSVSVLAKGKPGGQESEYSYPLYTDLTFLANSKGSFQGGQLKVETARLFSSRTAHWPRLQGGPMTLLFYPWKSIWTPRRMKCCSRLDLPAASSIRQRSAGLIMGIWESPLPSSIMSIATEITSSKLLKKSITPVIRCSFALTISHDMRLVQSKQEF